MPEPATRWVVLPDTEGEIEQSLRLLEDMMLTLQPLDDSERALHNLGPGELHALGRVRMRLFAAEHNPTPSLVAPDGRFEHVPLFFFSLLEDDLVAVGRAVAALGSSLLPGGEAEVREALRMFLRRGQTVEELVASFALVHGVLDLATDKDSRLLLGSLVPEQGRVVLSFEQEQAYNRLTARFRELRGNDPLERFLFQGP